MTAPVEQLHYTWAARGVEGTNRFQIAAMSPGLKSGPAAEAMPMIRRLCRYDPPRGAGDDLPVSFGWLDHESLRIAFRRVGLPAAMGKQGNFAAHLLVAPLDALPEAAVAALFGSPFWWDGPGEGEDDPSLELPTIALDRVPVQEAKPEAEELRAGVALAYHVFTKPEDSRLAVTASAAEVGRAARALALIAPDALVGLSFSTYEGRRVFPFDLLGSEAPEPGMDSCALSLPEELDERGLATLSQLAENRRLGSVASRIARREGGGGAAAIWQAARRIVGLGSGEEDGGNLLGDAGVVGFICATAKGRASVAAAVERGRPPVVAAVAAATAEMGEEEAGALAAAIAVRYREARTATDWAAAQGAFPEGPARELLADAVLDLVRGDPEAAATLGDEDAALVLAIAAGRGISVAEVRPVLRGSRGRIAACAREAKVPAAYLAAMFELGLEDLTAPQELAAAARERPELLKEVQIDGAERERCLRLLGLIDLPGRQVLLPAFLYDLADEGLAPRLRAVVQSLPPRVAALCVLEADRVAGEASAPEGLDPIREDLAARLLAAEDVSLTLRLLEHGRSQVGERATRLIRDAGGGARSAAAAAVDAEAELALSPLGEEVTRFAIDRAVAAIESPLDVAEVWSAMEATRRGADEEEVLRGLLEVATRRAGAYAAAEILGWIARVKLADSPKLLTRLGSLRDDDADELALDLATRVSARELEGMEESVEPTGRGAPRWWRRLRKRAEREESRDS